MPNETAHQTQTQLPGQYGNYVYRLTNAPDDYDYSSTSRYYGTDYEDGLMLVAIPTEDYNTQVGRYASGMFRCESPRTEFTKYFRRYTQVYRNGTEVHTDVTEVDSESIFAQIRMDFAKGDLQAVTLAWVWEEQA